MTLERETDKGGGSEEGSRENISDDEIDAFKSRWLSKAVASESGEKCVEKPQEV